MIMKIEHKDKLKLELFYNQKLIMLAGILPNIFIDVILQSKLIPSIDIFDSLQYWNRMARNFLKAHKKPVMIEYDAMVITYEGIKVGVKVTETYI